MRPQNRQVPVGAPAEVHHLVGDVLALAVAVQPQHEQTRLPRQVPEVLGQGLLVFRNSLVNWSLQQHLIVNGVSVGVLLREDKVHQVSRNRGKLHGHLLILVVVVEDVDRVEL